MCYPLTRKLLQKICPSRQEGGPVLKFFYLSDYPDMTGERFEFSSNGNILKGYKYYIGNKENKDIVIFHHGFGGGHNAYEDLLHKFAVHGYLVYTYDNSCCGDSEGSGWWNLSSSLADQENFFKWLDTDEDQKGRRRIVMGHSWGGFTAVNGLRYKVDKVVGISAFNRVITMITDLYKGTKILSPLILSAQKHYFGKYGDVNTLGLLQNSNIPVLLVHGEKDDVVNYQKIFLPLKEKLKDKENIKFYDVKDRYHQPYMSIRGQEYFRYLNESGIALGKVKDYPPIDYNLLLEIDEEVLNNIYSFIDEK